MPIVGRFVWLKPQLGFMEVAGYAPRNIVGLLAQRSYSVEELAALLNLKAPTVSHHLSKLAEAGLVTARAEGYYSIYQLDREALEAALRQPVFR